MGNCLFLKKEKYNENMGHFKVNDLKVDFIDNLNLHNKVILEKCDQNNMIELTNQNIKEIIEKTSQKIDYNIIKEEKNEIKEEKNEIKEEKNEIKEEENDQNINIIYEEREVEEEYIDISDVKEYIENDIKSHISVEDDNESQNSIYVERSESKSNDSTLKMESIE